MGMDIERNRIAGKCLRKFRIDAGLTQSQLAKRMNKSQSFISKVENAERELSLIETFFYAEALDAGYTVVVKEVHRSLGKAGLDTLAPNTSQTDKSDSTTSASSEK